MISLIWPYWNRQAVADRCLHALIAHYSGLDMELIVVDDGSDPKYEPPDGLLRHPSFPIKVIRLPHHDIPLSPCVPINRGVEASAGEIIALSGPDVLHIRPVLPDMEEEVRNGWPDRYVSAAVWGKERAKWLAHSSRHPLKSGGTKFNIGAQFHWMTMLSRDLWNRAGGFDEDYRDGTEYDGHDFLLRLERAGAEFITRDDLIVEHIRSNAYAPWTRQQIDRNNEVFQRKWRHRIARGN